MSLQSEPEVVQQVPKMRASSQYVGRAESESLVVSNDFMPRSFYLPR